MRRLELASAEIHNTRLIARNALSANGTLEFLEKTVEGHGADLANAVKWPNTVVSIPSKPARIRDRPKNFAGPGGIQVCTSQDIIDLIVFYNNDFGIVPNDGEAIRREKLLEFLTGQPICLPSRDSSFPGLQM
ncbi:hypothetical protein H0H92_002292 [Tricholoma furcatifolium]|nr:hypothetical protein H0H92_002292 [Tricholoma furcatifolium]